MTQALKLVPCSFASACSAMHIVHHGRTINFYLMNYIIMAIQQNGHLLGEETEQ